MNTFRVITNKPLSCPKCKWPADGAAGDKGSLPAEGDYTICIQCASFNKYQGRGMNLTIVPVTDNELAELQKEYPEFYRKVEHYRQQITEL